MTTTKRRKAGTRVRLQPLGDRVLIEREESPQQSAGGIVLPDQAKKKSKRGKVVGVGNGKLDNEGKRIPLAVKSGDRVLFSGYSGEEIEVNGKEVLIVREDDILALIHD